MLRSGHAKVRIGRSCVIKWKPSLSIVSHLFAAVSDYAVLSQVELIH